LTHNQVLLILSKTAEDSVGPADEDTPGRDDFYGHGRVNMERALLLVKNFQSILEIFGVTPQSFPDSITP
jgi:hypothetical protein